MAWPILLWCGASHSANAADAPSAAEIINSLNPRYALTGQSATCLFERGPRTGQKQSVTIMPLGAACTDGADSHGKTVFDAASVREFPVPSTRGIRVGAQNARVLHPVRAYLKASEIPPASVGAYGVVAFRNKPTTASRARFLLTCEAFVAFLPRQETLLKSVPLTDQMVTVWPLDTPRAKSAVLDKCDYVIEHYDLDGGLSAIRDAERQGARLDSRGPFLIGWSPASTRGEPDKVVLTVDMSAFDSQDSFDSAFLFWQKKIVQDPTLWRTGFSIEGIRLAVRDFVDHYGGSILDALKLTAGK